MEEGRRREKRKRAVWCGTATQKTCLHNLSSQNPSSLDLPPTTLPTYTPHGAAFHGHARAAAHTRHLYGAPSRAAASERGAPVGGGP